jgi:hypothetical protein
MNSKPDIIDISSDSSSTSSGWNNYFPPNASTSVTKKSKKKVEEPISFDDLPTPPPYVFDSSSSELPSYVPSFHSNDKEPLPLAMTLPRELEKAFEMAITSIRRIPVPENTLPRPIPAKQVLGLPNKHVWNEINERGVHKIMPDIKGKGKRPME